MARFKVYVSDYDYPDLDIERSVLEPIGAEVIGLHNRTGVGLADQAGDADAILQQYARIMAPTIARLQRCKVICRYGIGVDIVDVKAANEHGIIVTNVPDYCIDEVADHTIAMGFTLMRRLMQYNQATHRGEWHWSAGGGPITRFRNATWGLIGLGRIAQNIARKLPVFGYRILAYDPYVSQSLMGSFGVEKVDLPTLFGESDVVNVMCPYTPETHHIVNAEMLALMKPTAVVVNCSRGKNVDNNALYHALKSGQIAGAALDDVEEEPAKLDSWSPKVNPLFSLDNVIVTPHVAYVSTQSLAECRRIAAENAREVLLGRPPLNPVRP